MYFFTWKKYIGNTVRTVVIIIVNMRNNRSAASSKLENLAFIFFADVLLETCLLVVVMRGTFCYCRAWGLSKEAREGKTQVPYFVIKLSLSPLNSANSNQCEIRCAM